MAAKIFRINYKSDFIMSLHSDAGWMTPFCIKFWTGAPSLAYFVGWDGTTYTHCTYDPSEPTELVVQFDDHHLPIGDLKYQVAYHFTVADFPDNTEDEVINPANITTEIDGETYQVMLDFTGETAPEIQFALPAYANELQRIVNEQQRIADEQTRINNEETRISNEQTRLDNEAQRIRNEQTRISQEEARVREFATLKQESQEATTAANDAATLANQKAQLAADKAQLAADKAALAQDAATLANEKAQLAADKAALANDAAQVADDKAALAQQKAEYAQEQGSYAKEQGDYAKTEADAARDMLSQIGVFDVSIYNASEGVPATYASLTAALAAIPSEFQIAGLTLKFINSTTSKYEQYRLTSDTWSTTLTDWSGVVNELITGGTQNLQSAEIGKFIQNEISTSLSEVLVDQGTAHKLVYCGSDTTIGQVGEIVDSDSSNAYAASIELDDDVLAVSFFLHRWNGDYGYAFLNIENQVIESGIYRKMSASDTKATIIVPSGAVKINIGLYRQGSRDVQLVKGKSVWGKFQETDNLIAGVTSRIESLEYFRNDIEGLLFYEGTIVLTNQGTAGKNVYCGSNTSIGNVGDIVSSTASTAYAAEIQLEENYKTLTFFLHRWNGDYGYAFFNSSNQVIGSGIYKSMASSDTASYTLNIPNGAAYVRLSIYYSGSTSAGSRTVTIRYSSDVITKIEGEISDLQNQIDNIEIDQYETIGSPVPYISSLDTEGLSIITSVSELYSQLDTMAASYSDFLKKETDIGMDASNTYAIRHYTLRFQYPEVNTERDLSGTNVWSDTVFQIRRILLVMGVHGNERPSVLGGLLLIKELLESDENWARYIKDNFVIDIVPCANPWGFENNSRDNYNGVNLNRDYISSSPQSETVAMKSLIADLMTKGLTGIVDCHNCNYSLGGYLVAKTTYKKYHYYARLAQQIQSLMYAPLNTVFGTTQNNHFHLWIADGNNGQLHQYADSLGLLGCTFEIANNAGVSGALLTKSIAANIVSSFGAYH